MEQKKEIDVGNRVKVVNLYCEWDEEYQEYYVPDPTCGIVLSIEFDRKMAMNLYKVQAEDGTVFTTYLPERI